MKPTTRVRLIVLASAALAALAFGMVAAPVGAQENATDATPLQPGETVTGDIQSYEQWDVYSFDSEAGEAVNFEISRTGGTGDLLLIVVDPTDEELAWDLVGPDETVNLSAVPVDNGTHYALVAGNTENAIGPYSLTLLDEAPIGEPSEDVIEATPEEPTEVPDEEIRTLQPGEALDGELENADDSALFGLNATAGEPIAVELAREGGNGTFGVGIVDSDGNLLAVEAVEAGQSSVASTTVAQNGTYFVIVVGVTEDAAGPYSLTLLGSAIETPPEAPAEIPDEEIRTLQPGETLAGEIGGIDDLDGFVLDATAGESITVELAREGGNGIFGVGIADIEGELLSVDYPGPNETSTVSATAETDGTYLVVVVGVTEDSAGSYSLTLLAERASEVDGTITV